MREWYYFSSVEALFFVFSQRKFGFEFGGFDVHRIIPYVERHLKPRGVRYIRVLPHVVASDLAISAPHCIHMKSAEGCGQMLSPTIAVL